VRKGIKQQQASGGRTVEIKFFTQNFRADAHLLERRQIKKLIKLWHSHPEILNIFYIGCRALKICL
jgi:hypothetical protein